MVKRNYYLIILLMLLANLLVISRCYAEDLVDPTQPSEELAGAFIDGTDQNGLVLNAIIYSPSRRSAIINGTALSVNDSVNGFKLIAISPQSVVVQVKTGETMTLSLLPNQIKQVVTRQ